MNNKIANSIGVAGEFADRIMKSIEPGTDLARATKIELAERVMANIKMLGDIRNIIELKIIMERWEIKDDGKTYVFTLRDNIYFTDGDKLTSGKIEYGFTDVVVERPAERVIVFKLKDRYTPFIVTVSRKIFKKKILS